MFRHGVCECCNERNSWGQISFGWTQRNINGRYLCPECTSKYDVPAKEDKVYYLQSVSLKPLYIGGSLLRADEIQKLVEDVITGYRKTGQLPSRPGSNITVGYDYGLLLNSLTKLFHPDAGEIYEKMMSVIDSTGAWVEYYDEGRPMGTRCRPWESGINLEAAIEYALSKIWELKKG